MHRVIRIFLSTEGPAKWAVLASLLLASMAEGIGIASLLPALTVILNDRASENSPLHEMVVDVLDFVGLPTSLGVLLLLVVAGLTAKAVLVIIGMMHVGYAVADVSTNLRTSLVRQLLGARWAFFTGQPVGRFANAMSLDASRAAQAYLLAVMLIATTFQVTVSVILAFLVGWQLALVGIAVGGVIVLILGPLVRTAKKAGQRQQRSTRELVTLLSDTLNGLKPLKAMARQEPFLRLFEKKAKSLRKSLRRQAISQHLMKALREPIFAAFAAAGIYVVHTHFTIPTAQFVVMGILLERIVRSIGKVQEQLQTAVIYESGHRAVQAILDEAYDAREEYSGARRPTLDQGCTLEGVSFAFGDKLVLDGVSLTIPANQLTVIMGPSGVGKTTLIDLLLGLYHPGRGRVLIDGVPLREVDLRAWRRMIGYVPQELLLFHDTILANVSLGDSAISGDDAVEALRTAGAWDFVAALPQGVMTSVGERGMQLSGGQRQRIALARALVTKPRLLVCDEVTSALDPRTEAEICENVRQLDGQLTILAITHRPAWVDFADRVYELDPAGVRLVNEATRRLAVAPLG